MSLTKTVTSAKNIVLKVTARAFGYPGVTGGGNPVTVFMFPTTSHSQTVSREGMEIRTALAKTCLWESVTVHRHNDDDPDSTVEVRETLLESNEHSSENGNATDDLLYGGCRSDDLILRFYMPSGEEVPFCAHAAMGACVVASNEQRRDDDGFHKHDDKDCNNVIKFVSSSTEQTSYATINNNEISLRIEQPHNQTLVSPSQTEKLLSHIGLTLADTGISSDGTPITERHDPRLLPSFLNSSVARYKTLIPIPSLNTLHSAIAPTDPLQFQNSCDEISSTGVYLYTPVSTAPGNLPRYECRQFPRASGYPEDPATGIAAAALAASLERQRWERGDTDGSGGNYEMVQGTAMGKRSRLVVRVGDRVVDEDGTRGVGSIVCSGCVEIDLRTEVVIDSFGSFVE